MVINWLQKVLEDANIKLASVATDVTGVSARAMLAALIGGQATPEEMAELARGRLRTKREALTAALTGFVDEHHRFLLLQHLTLMDFLEEQIEEFSRQITAHLEVLSTPSEPTGPPAEGSPAPEPRRRVLPAQPPTYHQAVELLDRIPGLDRKVAEAVLAETGTDMGRFPADGNLASWAGVAPGNRESGGKRYSGKTTPGNPALRKALIQAAHGAIRTKGSYFGALYQRLASRRGKKKAIVAVARALVVVIYHVLLYQEPYRELGGNYFDERKKETVVQQLVRRLEKLGHQVTLALTPQPLAA